MANVAEKMCGNRLIVKEKTGKEGYICNSIFIVERFKVEKELFLHIGYDIENQCVAIFYSDMGGISFVK